MINSKKTEQKKLAMNLRRRVYESMIYLGLPTWLEVKNEGVPENQRWRHLYHGAHEILDFFSIETANHIARVTLDSVAVGDFLGMNVPKYGDCFEAFVYAANNHDIGKIVPDINELSEKRENFTSEDMERMKEHVGISLALSNFNDKLSQLIIMYHHYWQRNSYLPSHFLKNPSFQLTPEAEVLSKILAFIDFHDSVSTRANTKFSRTPKIPIKQDSKELLLKEYGNLPLIYQGEQLPLFETNGGELINSLYEQGIFGRRDPCNPYPKPYSFIIRKGFFETRRARNKVKARQKEIRMKNEKYSK